MNQDGLFFVGMLRKILPDIPIIVSSGRLEAEAEHQFRALGPLRSSRKCGGREGKPVRLEAH